MSLKGKIPWSRINGCTQPKPAQKEEKPTPPPSPRQKGMGRGQMLQYVRSVYGDRHGEAKLREELRSCKTLCDYSNDAIERRYNRGMPLEDTPPAINQGPAVNQSSPPAIYKTAPHAINKTAPSDAYKGMTSAKKFQNGRRQKNSKWRKFVPPSDQQKPDVDQPTTSSECPGTSGKVDGLPRLFSDNVQLKYRNALIQNLKNSESKPTGHLLSNSEFPALQ